MRLNPRQVERMMKQMGITADEVEAEEVIIRTREKEIVITRPHVSRMNMMGQDTFQVTGQISERPVMKFSKDDLKMVMDQTGASADEAMKALEETEDIAEAILRLKKDEEG